MNVAEFLIAIVSRLGAKTIFSVTGGMAMHVNRAVAESSLSVIYCNHEQAVVAAADGHAKATDYSTPGVAVVTSGPGVMNTVNAVASAHYDSVPVIVIAGQVKVADINRHGVRSFGAQETPQLDVLRPITKAAFRYDPREVSDERIADLLGECMRGRKGPVFVEVPLDVQSMLVEAAEERLEFIQSRLASGSQAPDQTPSRAAGEFLEALSHCRRPVLVLGNGLHIAGVRPDTVRRLVESLGIPTLFTWPSADLLEHSHDLNFGCPGGLAPTHANVILQQADAALFLGVRLDLLTTAFNPSTFGRRARRLVVDCDPAEIAKNKDLPNAIFFREDVRHVITGILSSGFNTHSGRKLDAWREWLDACRHARETDRREEAAAFPASDLTAYSMTGVLSRSSAVRYIVPTGSGYAVEGFARFFRPRRGVTVAFAGHCLGSMGLALPMAIGAAAAREESVICLEGDGGLLFNVQEIYTLAAHPWLKVRIVVMNNGGYQSIVRSQTRIFGKEFGASPRSGLCAPRFDLLAQAVGIPYARCETVAELTEVLAAETSQQIIDVFLKEDGYRGPAVTTKFDAEGKPYSTDIEQIDWSRP